MESRLKINPLLIAVTAILAVSCSPKALIKDQSGTQLSVKKIRTTDRPLLIRFDGGTIVSSFKKVCMFRIDPTIRQIYAGESWVRVEFSIKKDKKATVYKGWIPQLTQLRGKTSAGTCELDLANITEVDFMMGKAKKTAAPANASKTPVADSSATPAQ